MLRTIVCKFWWRSSHVCGRSSDFRVQLYRQTDGWRTPRDCISSWNELTRSPAVARMADRTAPLQTIYAKAVVHSCKSVQPFSHNVAVKEIYIAASRGLLELTQKCILVVPWSLHTFPENFLQIGPAIFSYVADKEISIAASRGLPKLIQNVIRSSHGHSTPIYRETVC